MRLSAGALLTSKNQRRVRVRSKRTQQGGKTKLPDIWKR